MNKPKEKRNYPQNLYAVVFGLGRDEQVVVPDDVDETLESVLSTLTEREKGIIRCRYEENKRCEPIGEMYGICGQRVSQIERKALRKLRHPARSRRMQLGNREYEKYVESCEKEIQLLRSREIESIKKKAEVNATTLTIDELGLSVRLYNCLKRCRLENLKEVCETTPEQYTGVRNFGTKSAQELLQKLGALGIDYVNLHEGEFDETTAIFFGLKDKEVNDEQFQRNPAMQD